MAEKLNSFKHTPDERKRYIADYSEWVLDGETLTSMTPSIDNTTVPPLVVDDISLTQTTAVFFVSGGEDDEEYKVTLHTVTSLGQEKEDYIVYVVRDI
jgi:hypothetical protein